MATTNFIDGTVIEPDWLNDVDDVVYGTGNASTNIRSSTYTPTLTNVTNVASSTVSTALWIRVGNMVIVSGLLSIDPTSGSTQTVIEISLPIVSDLSSNTQLSGTAVRATVSEAGMLSAYIAGQTTNNTAELVFLNDAGTASRSWRYQFMYQVA